MIGMTGPNPTDTCCLRLADRHLGGVMHHQMSEPIVAINQRRRGAILHGP